MANRGDVISVDKLWDVFDAEREKAWEGVDAPIGSPEWNAAAGKIDTINNICEAVHNMNTCSRADGENAKKPGWRCWRSEHIEPDDCMGRKGKVLAIP